MRKALADMYYKIRYLLVKQLSKQSKRRPLNYKRIYQFHIRKTAGTSVNAAFWEHSGHAYNTVGRKNVLFGNGLVMVRNDIKLIESGHYFYGNSHTPYWKLNLPSDTYTFCIFRDPYERLCSLYNYYKWILELDPSTASKQEPYYSSLIPMAKKMAQSFDGFLDLISKSDLQNQLYQFSEKFDVNEALENTNKLKAVFFQDKFEVILQTLSTVSSLNLKLRRDRKSTLISRVEITESQRQRAMKLLADEYQFYKAVREKFA